MTALTFEEQLAEANQLLRSWVDGHKPVTRTLDHLHRTVRSTLIERSPTQLTVHQIQFACAERLGVSTVDIVTYTRSDEPIITARKLAMFLCRKLTRHSWPALGNAFRRDHSTVMHASRKVKASPELIGLANEIESALLSQTRNHGASHEIVHTQDAEPGS